jgi:GTP-binding protein
MEQPSVPPLTTPLDEGYTAEALEYGRWLFAQSCEFVRGVPTLDQLIDFDKPEIAFAGRSNVGKSSLINALTGQKTLARTSNTPGRTQQLNFFNLGERLYLVDMPGYGYAEAPKEVVAKWRVLIEAYLRGRPTLQRTYLLLDTRVEVKKHDLEIMDQLDQAAVSYQLVLTKGDKAGVTQLRKRGDQLDQLIQNRPAAHPKILMTSSVKHWGINELRAEIARFARQKSPL